MKRKHDSIHIILKNTPYITKCFGQIKSGVSLKQFQGQRGNQSNKYIMHTLYHIYLSNIFIFKLITFIFEIKKYQNVLKYKIMLKLHFFFSVIY